MHVDSLADTLRMPHSQAALCVISCCIVISVVVECCR